VRRQTECGGATPAGAGRALRLDPFALPVRFTAADAKADERVRMVELHRERVVLRRAVSGMRMAVNVPVSTFRGVALRLFAGESGERMLVSLEHHDAALSVPLVVAGDSEDVIAEWQLWARVLGLPLLVAEPGGTLHEPFRRIGAVRVGRPAPRRRRRNVLAARRPSILLRRRPGRRGNLPVHQGEREIIARN
jgi:hypothetical protein